MLCPNCDNIINASGCQSCGWKMGDPFPVHRLSIDSSHPLKEGVGIYPPRIGGPRAIQIVHDGPVAAKIIAAAFEPEIRIAAPELKQDQMIVPEPESATAPIPDPVSKTVQ